MSSHFQGSLGDIQGSSNDPCESDSIKGEPGIGWRHGISLLASCGFFCVMSQRVAFTIALVAMVNSSNTDANFKNSSVFDECPPPQLLINSSAPEQTGEFNWDSSTQNLLLGAMFYGYVITQLPGGLLAELTGPRIMFGLTCLIPGIITFLTPFIARWSVTALVASRVIIGLCQGPVYPINHSMLSRWSPVLERSIHCSLSTSGAVISYFVSFIVSGYLASTSFLSGWPLPLYLSGVLSTIWFILWMILARDSPSEHPFISTKERNYIESSLYSSPESRKYNRPPWKAILTSPTLWSQGFYYFCEGIGFYVVFSVMPVYLHQVLHYDISQDGLATSYPYLGGFFVQLGAGLLADGIRRKGWLSTTALRKICTFIASGSLGLCIMFIGFVSCDHSLVVALVIIGYSLLGFSASGCSAAFLDYAPRYAGTLLGLCNPLGNLGGFLSPTLSQVFSNHFPGRKGWQYFFFFTSGLLIGGPILFAIFGTSELQPWAMTEEDRRSLRPLCVDVDADEETADGPNEHDQQQSLIQ